MDYLKHLFSSDFILVAGVFGILFYFLYDAIKRKKWGWAIFLAILPLGFISVPLYILFGFNDGAKSEDRNNSNKTD
jgi:ABC-type anion transport system duplicated permease subunit